MLKWSQEPDDVVTVREPVAEPRGERPLRRWFRRAWRAWLREWSVFAPPWGASGDGELV